jgi:putative transposase
VSCPAFIITSRSEGTNREDVFHSQQDREVYLSLATEHLKRGEVNVVAYCLMANHVHWIVKPLENDAMAILFQRVHGRYAQYFNPLRKRCGHLWQNRYYSCALSTSHLKTAIQYVEWNPIRAGVVENAADYEWSSAAAHIAGPSTEEVLPLEWDCWHQYGGQEGWRNLLETPPDIRKERDLRRCTYSGRPLGDGDFVGKMEEHFGRQWRSRGRPRKQVGNEQMGTDRSMILSAG